MTPLTSLAPDAGRGRRLSFRDALRAFVGQAGGVVPGLFLATFIAAQAFALRALPGLSALSPLILAIVLGMLFHNIVGTPARAKAGVTFALRRVLRFGIVLLGLQLTLGQVAAVGAGGVAVIALTLVATFVVTLGLGRLLGLDRRLSELIAAGTSICGASAVIATNTVTQGSDEDVAYAVACVTVFGSLSMLAYPLLPSLVGLDAHGYGLWAGASIHEVAQVVAAAFQHSDAAGEFGTIAKLTRVMMLAPMVLSLGFLAARRAPGRARKAPPMPWFVLGFVAMVLVASTGLVPAAWSGGITGTTQFLLAVALAAMGLETDIAKLAAKGWRPLILGAAAWVFITGFSLALIKLGALA